MTTKASSQVDQDLLKTIAELLNQQNLAEIEIEQEGFRVRVTRAHASSGSAVAPVYAAAPQPAHLPAQSAPLTGIPAPAVNDDLSSNPGTLTSPMVGTAYRAPEPGASPFVEVGARVSEGQTVLVIEAMKTMNQIPAHRSGIVARILVDDAQPVEYGEPLIVIE